MPTNPVTSARQFAGAEVDLAAHGLRHTGKVHAQLSSAALVELAVRRGEGFLTDSGAFAAYTGAITGRSPKDRYLVPETARADEIWWGPVNRPMAPAVFDRLFDRVRAYLQGRDLFVCDASACADPRLVLPVRVVADQAWHALFAQCLLRPPADRPPELTVVCAGGMQRRPRRGRHAQRGLRRA